MVPKHFLRCLSSFVLFFAISRALIAQEGSGRMLLNEGWEFREAGKKEWLPARVPGTVHTDLVSLGLIPDPFLLDNENRVQWVGETDWEYRLRFVIPALQKNADSLFLRFEGLDTYAFVSLNGKKLLAADNMFRSWRVGFDCSNLPDTNELQIHFPSIIRLGKEAYSRLPAPLPDDYRVMVRKAPFQFGWDWGAKLIGPGIWKKVWIEQKAKLEVRGERLVTRTINKGKARADCQFFVHALEEGPAWLQLKWMNGGSADSLEQAVALPKGENQISIPLVIKKPRLWQCKGEGSPELYRFELSLVQNGRKVVRQWRSGIRIIRLLEEGPPDAKEFTFELNGRRVFAKGANYVPADHFPHRLGPHQYRKVLEMARDAGMNMLRVWGGGVYPDDAFFDLADEMGIMIWQDFMFACAMYPGDSLFTANVREEAEEQVLRLRGHPSLVLWCGNNEISEGWHNWGWQKSLGYSPSDSARIWKDYLQLFENLLPEVVSRLDGTRPYHPSSPRHGWGRPASLKDGDMHYWGVWWGDQPFSIYREKTGRFMSEYGFQGSPDLASLRECLPGSALSIENPVLRNHQKHPRGFELIASQMERHFPVPSDFRTWVYLSQLTQSLGMEVAIGSHRMAMPHCMGTLFWQLNDSWPVISWSAFDYYRRPKAFYYHLKDWYAPLAGFCFEESGRPLIGLVNDGPVRRKGLVSLSHFDENGELLGKAETEVLLKPNEARYFPELSMLLGDSLPGDQALRLVWSEKGDQKIDRIFFSGLPRDARLPDPEIRILSFDQVLPPPGPVEGLHYRMLVSCSRVARQVMFFSERYPIHSQDNFVDMLPGEPIEIMLRSWGPLKKEDIQWMSLYDTLPKD